MKAVLTVLSLLVLSPCQAVGFGSNLLSFITGKHAELPAAEPQQLPVSEHFYETRVAKNADIDSDQESSNSFLETLSLSYGGNLDISNAVGQVSGTTSL